MLENLLPYIDEDMDAEVSDSGSADKKEEKTEDSAKNEEEDPKDKANFKSQSLQRSQNNRREEDFILHLLRN